MLTCDSVLLIMNTSLNYNGGNCDELGYAEGKNKIFWTHLIGIKAKMKKRLI